MKHQGKNRENHIVATNKLGQRFSESGKRTIRKKKVHRKKLSGNYPDLIFDPSRPTADPQSTQSRPKVDPFKTAKVANVLSGNYPETILNLSGMGVVSTWGRPRIKKVKEIHEN